MRISPALIVIGGFAGTGKTAISKRLSAEFGMPRLGSDILGRTIKQCIGTPSREVNAYWIAYEVLFRLCREFLEAGVSTILDLTMGWEFQWQQVDSITGQYPQVLFLPIILRCPREVCLDRIRQRYEANPTYYDPPEVYMSEPKNSSLWIYLRNLTIPPFTLLMQTGLMMMHTRRSENTFRSDLMETRPVASQPKTPRRSRSAVIIHNADVRFSRWTFLPVAR